MIRIPRVPFLRWWPWLRAHRITKRGLMYRTVIAGELCEVPCECFKARKR